MAAGALHLDSHKRAADDMSFRGHRGVVLRRDAESRRSDIAIAAHAYQIRYELVHGFVVGKGFVYPPSEGACVV